MEPALPNPFMISIKIVIGLAFVIGLIYLVCLILKKIQENKTSVYGRPILELVSTINLGVGPGKSVHIVRAADRFLVIGATTAKITLLAEIDKGLEEMKVGNKTQDAEAVNGRGFDELLEAYTQKFVYKSQMSRGLEDHKDER
ncbi:MAG: flagellar biosynthetic protein FliO [Firmicutes bacterium]|nr:flagellar biosynthetic protein FliO [Bacillota bacterium]HXL04569.1 flagellar biosynthetic protein FliO [Bacillota bacterium]